ncbi:MAG: nucleotide exchange factor GrpE [Actinomycetota bacterium]|nr:nucleotide exchange factor GrpE [Actinomycetota bacterium]
MTRPSPEEAAVREQMRERDEASAGERETTTDGAGAAAEAAAPERPAEAAEAAQPEEAQPEEAQPEEPQDPLAKAEAERDQYLDLARRTQAEFENYRKRTAQQAAQAGERAKLGLLRELLPVVDNLERALASAAEDEGPLAQGVQLVLGDLQGVLAREGVDALEPVGERFDPTVHEALSTRPEEGAEAGVVVEVVEKGYRTRDTVIRPARVVVSA